MREFDRVAVRESRRFFFPGHDRDDVLQEARLALLEAHRAYRPSTGVEFGAFATLCVRRRLSSKLRNATADKHQLLTGAFQILDGDRLGPDPAGQVEARMELARVAALPEKQRDRIVAFACGYSYEEIAAAEGVSKAAVDVSIFQARKTLRGDDAPVTCSAAGCGREFERKGPQKFCSPACQQRERRKRSARYQREYQASYRRRDAAA